MDANKEALRFITALTGHAGTAMQWQLFNDARKGEPSPEPKENPGFFGPLEGCILKTLSSYQEKGYGVHVVINEATGGRRMAANVRKVRACYADGDGIPLPSKWPAAPHILCKRSPTRWHAYWLIAESDCRDFHGWKDCQAWIAASLGSDNALTFPHGTLRIPGYLHQKDPSRPTSYEVASDLSDLLPGYRYAQLREAFPLSIDQEYAYRKIMFPPPKPELDPKYVMGTEDDPEMEAAARKSIEWIDVEEGRNRAAFKIAGVCGDFNLTPGKALEIASDVVEDGDEDEMREAVNNAYRYRKNLIGIRCPEIRKDKTHVAINADVLSGSGIVTLTAKSQIIVDFDKPLLGSEGKVSKSAENIMRMLCNKDGLMSNAYYYDQFAESVRWSPGVRLPFEMNGYRTPDPNRFVTDSDMIQLRCYLLLKFHADVPVPELWTWLTGMASQMRNIHPIKEFIESKPWDGKPRMNELFNYYCSANPTSDKHPQPRIYREYAGMIFLVNCIARAYRPGCQNRIMLILEGNQNIGKSTLFETLGGEWHRELPIDLSSSSASKDTFLTLRNAWILENAELNMSFRESNQLKAFISKPKDSYRPPYGRQTYDVPRRCVIVGTTNPQTMQQYTDQTGETRKMPVYIDGVPKQPSVRRDELERDRQQLFAEAYSYWLANGDIYPTKFQAPDHENVYPLFEKEVAIRMKTPRYLDEAVEWFERVETQEELRRGQAIPMSRIILEVGQKGTTVVENRDRDAIASILQFRLGMEIVKDKYGRESYALPEFFEK